MSSVRSPAWRQVACRFLRLQVCARCGVEFECCSCQPGRRYCTRCSPEARAEREQRARRSYRQTEDGRAQHRDEEAARRERQSGVGDRRPPAAEFPVQVEEAAEGPEAGRTGEDEPMLGSEDTGEAEARSACGPPPAERRALLGPRLVEWVLVARPGQLERGRELLGTEVECPWCGRRGRVACVITPAAVQRLWRPSARAFLSGDG
jgi:hypothetical protein